MLNAAKSSYVLSEKGSVNSAVQSKHAKPCSCVSRQREVQSPRCQNALKRFKSVRFMATANALLSSMSQSTSGIVKIVSRCYEAGFKTTTQIRTHHFLPTLKPLEKNCGLVSKSLLKIRVSMVRFRPRPPHTHRSLAKGYGVFVCASHSAIAVQ